MLYCMHNACCSLIIVGHNELTVIECPVLPPPTNGTISLPSVRTPGTLAEYTCLSGHVLLGDRQRVCLDSGVWNGTEPSCLGMKMI